jgi:NIPSNAP
VDHGALYPALQRLEAQKWITAKWGTSTNNRRARRACSARNRRRADGALVPDAPSRRLNRPVRLACRQAAVEAFRSGAIVIIEMRTYKTKPGKRAEFLEIFEARSVPEHQKIGMKILGPFLSVEDPDVFFFMRGFPNLDSRDPMKAQFYEGELWKQQLEHRLMPMLEKYDVVLVEADGGLGEWR